MITKHQSWQFLESDFFFLSSSHKKEKEDIREDQWKC